MANLEKEIKKEEKQIRNLFKKTNTWIIISAILLILLLVVGFMNMPVTKSSAGKKILAFAEEAGVEASLVKVSSLGDIYQVDLSIQGQAVPVYITKDGKYFIQGATLLTPKKSSSSTTKPTTTEVPKTDKPVVEAFVFTYCPYGLQFEKALAPVYNLLKNNADIRLVQIGAMHGEHEQIEAYRQLCIEKNYGKDKLWAYLNLFMINDSIGTCNSDMACSKPLVESIMKKISIDVTKINTCMSKDAKALYDADGVRATSLGVSGSPTFVINGVEVSVSRSPEAIKTAVCDAFNNKPNECSQTLSTASASAWFGGSTTSSASSSAQC